MTFGWIIVATQQRFLPPKKKPSTKDPRFSCFWAFVSFLFHTFKLCSFPFSNLYMFFPDFLSEKSTFFRKIHRSIHPRCCCFYSRSEAAKISPIFCSPAGRGALCGAPEPGIYTGRMMGDVNISFHQSELNPGLGVKDVSWFVNGKDSQQLRGFASCRHGFFPHVGSVRIPTLIVMVLAALFFPKLRSWRVAKHEAIFGVYDVRMTDWRMYTHANVRYMYTPI